jgi:hypothetical protein
MLGAASISRIRYWDVLAARDAERMRIVTCCAYFDRCRAGLPKTNCVPNVQACS